METKHDQNHASIDTKVMKDRNSQLLFAELWCCLDDYSSSLFLPQKALRYDVNRALRYDLRVFDAFMSVL